MNQSLNSTNTTPLPGISALMVKIKVTEKDFKDARTRLQGYWKSILEWDEWGAAIGKAARESHKAYLKQKIKDELMIMTIYELQEELAWTQMELEMKG